MSLEAHLESLGIPTVYTFKAEGEQVPVRVDYVNKQFLVFDKDDYDRLKKTFRMVAESVSSCKEEGAAPQPPYMLLPEQVSVLSQYGHIRVRRLKMDEDLYDPSAFLPSCSHNASAFESDFQKARQIAIGRKAKELKRKLNGADAPAKKLKVSSYPVTEEEVQAVARELTTNTDESQAFINLPLYYKRDDFYEEIDHLQLSLPNTADFRRRELVLHDLWRRGFYLTAGIRFGCHYLAYEGLPGEVHSRFLVQCVDVEANLSPMNLISLTRVGTQVKKTVLLACVADNSQQPQYLILKWFKPFDR